MATFNLDTQSITNTSSIYEAISNAYYPNGEIVVKNTSLSLAGPSRERTLTSRTLSDALTGDTLYRSPKFSGTFYNKSVSSSLNSLLTGGSEATFSTGTVYSINDPESIASSTKLTGGAAFSRIILDTVAGKNAGIDFIEKAADSISYDNSTYKSFPQSTAEYEPGSVETTPLADDSVSIGPSGGARFIVLESQITAEEKGWILERGAIAKNTGSVSSGASDLTFFYFDIDDNLTDLSNTKSYFPDANMSEVVPTDLIKAQKQKAMMCPAMIELIIYLSSKLKMSGGTGAFRAGNPNQQGSMLSPAKSGEYISDHVFGRGFDITSIGPLDGSDNISFQNEGPKDSNRYRKGLELLLGVLNSAPSHLVPDCVTFHEKLGPEYGVSKGNEEATSPIKTKYPNLRYVNFGSNSGHNNHVHISFSGARGGIYTGPGGQMGVETGSNSGSTVPAGRPGDSGSGTTAPAPTPTPTSNPTTVNPPDPTSTAGSNTGDAVTDPASTSAPIEQIPPSSGNALLDYLQDRQEKNPFAITNPTSPATGSNGITVVGDIAVPSDLSDPKFTKNYQDDLEGRLTRAEIFAMLRLTVFSDEASALFAAVTQRESGGCPTSFNPIGSDWSIGFFQINLLPGANGMHVFNIPLPSTRSELGWKLGYKDYDRDGVNEKTFKTVKEQKLTQMTRHEARVLVDPAVWIPVNQAYMCYTVATGGGVFNGTKLGETPESAGTMFNPWGEYGGGPSWGWISNVKFSDAAEMYATTGKTAQQLADWVIQYFKTSGKNSKSAPYAEKWTQGYMYEVDFSVSRGWHNQRETPPS